MKQDIGASLRETGSRASTEPQSSLSLGPPGFDPARDLDDAYQRVGEALDYFDSHRLPTWAPVAALFVRERNRGRAEGLDQSPALFAALDLAANRLLACAVNAGGNRESYAYSQWAREAREAAEVIRKVTRVSDSDRNGENPERSGGVEGEASQSGGEAVTPE